MRIVYNAFEGRYADSPRTIHDVLRAREPGHSHVWLADPRHLHQFPDGVETVVLGSPECIAALEAADLLVANAHTDMDWVKRPEAVYLQTWHGTPLKRIHWDVLWAPPGRLERLSADVARWDFLVSPNAFSTEPLRGAFRFEGEILETGYPRNDVLNAPGRDEIRARVRRELGVADDEIAVLYTPTWRDDEVFGDSAKEFSLALDLDDFARRLGDGHKLLLRLHYFVTSRLGRIGNPAVVDVSDRPEVSELYLAADAMVTDYSSTMFDFAVTGKPILHFAYDLEYYRGELRGFYFDFIPDAPGPVVSTSPELLDALADLPAIEREYAGAAAAFRERFCHLEDGHATDRVLDRVLDEVARRGGARDPGS
jgi:CDP-glycerol glycerophosphotransferase